MTAARTVIWEFDTAVWWQQLAHGDSGYVLSRKYRRPTPVAVPGGGPPKASAGRARFVTACHPGSDDGHRFSLSGDRQLATQLWPRTQVAFAGGGVGYRTMGDIGRLLATLHRDGPTPDGVVGPHVQRLRDHLTDPTGPGAAALATLPPTAIARLRTIAHTITDRGTAVPVHGGFSLGSVFTDAEHHIVDVVVGPESSSGPAEIDLGWMVGELTEFEFTARNSGAPDQAAVYAQAADALLTAYVSASGHALDRVLLDDVVVARIVLHMLDFAVTTSTIEHCVILAPFVAWLVEGAEGPTHHNDDVKDGTP